MSVCRSTSLDEPRWISLPRLRGVMLPDRLGAWLHDDGSLTRALVDSCEGRFSVLVTRQGWGGALPSERQLLRMPAGLTALVREVKLMCNDQPWVFARTLIPTTSLRGPARRLARLRNRPLGAVLFADPGTRRMAVEVARITPRHALFQAACSHLDDPPSEVWGRRTLFSYRGYRLLVNEIFLPSIPTRKST